MAQYWLLFGNFGVQLKNGSIATVEWILAINLTWVSNKAMNINLNVYSMFPDMEIHTNTHTHNQYIYNLCLLSAQPHLHS